MERERALTETEALRIIQGILSLMLLGLGLYMIGPWYVVNDAASFSAVINVAGLFVKLVAFIQAVAGAIMLYGAIVGNHTWNIVGIWLGFSMFTLIVAMRLIFIGPVPVLWMPQLANMLICAVLALAVGRR